MVAANLTIEEPKPLAQTVAAKIEESIIFGEIAGGIHLTEESIEQRTKVSRSPIREALRILEKDGLVVREPRRGVFVAPLSLADLEELYPCRIALESIAASLAAQNVQPDEIAEIWRAQEECAACLARDDIVGQFRGNVALSHLIHRAAHNSILLSLLGAIHKRALRYRFLAYKRSHAARSASIENNARIIAAIERRSADEAASQIRHSIEASQHILRDVLAREFSVPGA